MQTLQQGGPEHGGRGEGRGSLDKIPAPPLCGPSEGSNPCGFTERPTLGHKAGPAPMTRSSCWATGFSKALRSSCPAHLLRRRTGSSLQSWEGGLALLPSPREGTHLCRPAACRCSVVRLFTVLAMCSMPPKHSEGDMIIPTSQRKEAQRQEVIYPGSPREPVLGPEFKLESPDPWP